ncbi:ras-related protein Rab-6A-like isoform X2 [Haliotis rubra]|uniref:ras-related protein Rab-6A-like isoform X2 n=1 Tax=Haliotis rubra TaxID=36100 RepID=UPI001EE5C523|nr:ras-related protein Rab-6A-like isoform X2 [Haliotis rubra]
MLTWPRNKAPLIQQQTSITDDKVDCDKWKCGTVKRHNIGGQVIAAKVTLVGNVSTGKTSLALRYCRGSIDAHPKPTVAVDWLHHSEMVNNRRVNLQIWDTAGQEKFEAVMPNFLRSSAAVLLCYDVTDVDGEQFARENRLQYIETSAKTGHNVDGLFYEIAARVAGMWTMNYANANEFHPITIEEDRKARKKCQC